MKKPMIRQGDVPLKPYSGNIPENYKKVPSRTLAEGEATGHHHSFEGFTAEAGDIDLYIEDNTLAVNDRGIIVDVLGVPVADIIAHLEKESYCKTDAKTLAKVLNNPKIAKGKGTPYFHEESKMFTFVPDCEKAALLTHQEHRPRIVPEGRYQREMQREYSPSGAYRVID
jgi:hypothetical protein